MNTLSVVFLYTLALSFWTLHDPADASKLLSKPAQALEFFFSNLYSAILKALGKTERN